MLNLYALYDNPTELLGYHSRLDNPVVLWSECHPWNDNIEFVMNLEHIWFRDLNILLRYAHYLTWHPAAAQGSSYARAYVIRASISRCESELAKTQDWELIFSYCRSVPRARFELFEATIIKSAPIDILFWYFHQMFNSSIFEKRYCRFLAAEKRLFTEGYFDMYWDLFLYNASRRQMSTTQTLIDISIPLWLAFLKYQMLHKYNKIKAWVMRSNK